MDTYEQLADEAADLRRKDTGKKKPMKEYFGTVLRRHGLNVTRKAMQEMGRILGSRGGHKTARLRSRGQLKTTESKGLTFAHTLFDGLVPPTHRIH